MPAANGLAACAPELRARLGSFGGAAAPRLPWPHPANSGISNHTEARKSSGTLGYPSREQNKMQLLVQVLTIDIDYLAWHGF